MMSVRTLMRASSCTAKVTSAAKDVSRLWCELSVALPWHNNGVYMSQERQMDLGCTFPWLYRSAGADGPESDSEISTL